MSWTEIYTAYRRTKDAANTASGLIKFLEAGYSLPAERGSTVIWACGKTFDYKETIKAVAGGNLFGWDATNKRWTATVRDDQIDGIAEDLAESTEGLVWIETDTDSFGRRTAASGPAGAAKKQDDDWPIPEKDIPF